MTTSNQSTPTGSKLENATKEDLIKLLKRQQLLQKKHIIDSDNAKAHLQVEIDNLKNELESSNALVAQLRKENDDIYNSNSNISREIEELKSAVQRTTDEREDSTSELELLRENKQSMTEILHTLQKEQTELEEQLHSLVHELKAEKDERLEERRTWQSHIADLQEKLNDTELKLSNTESELKISQTESAKSSEVANKSLLQKEIVQVKSDISSLKDEGQSLKEVIKEYNDQFAKETKTISQVLQVLDNPAVLREKEDLVRELRELQRTVEELRASDAANRETTLLVSEEDRVLQTRGTCSPTVQDDDATVERLTSTIIELEGALAARELELSNMSQELLDLEEEKRKMSAHLDRFLEENVACADESQEERELSEDYTVLQTTLDTKETEIERLTVQLTALQDTSSRECTELAAELALCKEQLFEQEDANETLMSQNETFSAENETLSTSVRETLVVLQTEKDSSHSQIFLLEEQLGELTGELESERLRVDTLEYSGKESTQLVLTREADVTRLKGELKTAMDINNKLKEDSQGSQNLLDMELADYQRAATALEVKLNTSKGEAKQLEEDLRTKEDVISRSSSDIKELEKQRSGLDEMITKLKAMLMKTKKDAADSRKAEDDATRQEETTRHELERATQQLEETKFELSEVTGKLALHVERSREVQSEKSAMVKNLEHRVQCLQEHVDREKQLRVEVGAEFENYKVRVHSVLKQRRNSDTIVTLHEHEVIVSQLSKEAELLKCQVHELIMSRDLVTSEKETIEREVVEVVRTLDKIERDNTDREKFYLERVSELEDSLQEKEHQLYRAVESSALQRTALTQSYTSTLEQTNSSHRDTVQVLQSKIDTLQCDLSDHQRAKTDHVTPDPVSRPRVRLAAEGMESPDSAPGLEDILNSSLFSRSSSVSVTEVPVVSTKEDPKIAHLSGLLRETEHNAAAMQEQCTVLKSEVRRLEKMLGRDNTNIEYLKNVVIKFVTSDVPAREHLVPVLTTVLNLSREERLIVSTAAGTGRQDQVPWSSSWFSSS